MPPKKKQKTETTTTSKPSASAKKKSSKATPVSGARGRRSKSAKNTGLTAAQEAGVKEAWSLFAKRDVEGWEEDDDDNGGMGVIRRGDVGRCLAAQDLAPPSNAQLEEFLEILDPEDSGFVTYPHFLEICALQIQARADNDEEDDDEEKTRREEEVTAAMRLFTQGVERDITLEDLRRVRGVVGEEGVGDEVLRAMVGEANKGVEGGVGGKWTVGREGFRGVMVRAGVLR